MKEQNFLNLLDYFVFDKFRHNNDVLHNARILAGVLIAYAILVTVVSSELFLFFPDQGKNLVIDNVEYRFSVVDIGALSTFLTAVVFFSLLYVLKYSGNYNLVCRLTFLTEYLVITAAICLTGGPSESNVTQMLVLPCITAFCLRGIKPGMVWSGIALATLLLLTGLDLNGMEFFESTDPEYKGETRAIILLVSFMAIISIIVINEMIKQRLKIERDREHKRYVHLAQHDPLTELANRNYFEQRLVAATVNQQRRHQGQISCLIYIDLDNFKPINDNYGHDIGDDILRMVAKRLVINVRNSDTVARIGGDEFAIILTDMHREDEIKPIAEKIVQSLKDPFYIEEFKISISASVGIAFYPLHTLDPTKLKKFADIAMYTAKEERDQWQIFNDEMIPEKTTVSEAI